MFRTYGITGKTKKITTVKVKSLLIKGAFAYNYERSVFMKKTVKSILTVISCVIILLVCMIAAGASYEGDIFADYGYTLVTKEDYLVAPGVKESYIVTLNDDGTNQIKSYALEVDMSNPEIGIITSYKNYMNNLAPTPEWGMQTVREQAVSVEKYYKNVEGNEDFEVVAGVNGDFFNMGNGAPTGTLVMNGNYYNINEDWPYFAILDDGTAIIRDRSDPVVDNIAQGVGGPEVIVKNGAFAPAVETSGYGVDQHPRTAVGIKANGDIVFVVSDGRQAPGSCGQTFHELAVEMLALGCVDALSLDGGGSASLVSQRTEDTHLLLRNVPSDGLERTVSTSVLIYSNTSTNVFSETEKWFENEKGIGYYGADGKAVTGEQTIGGFKYVFDGEGVLQSFAVVDFDGTLKKNQWSGTKYYLGEDGLPVKSSVTINDNTFFFNHETGLLERSELKNKWYSCDGNVCYFDGEGNLSKGTKTIDGYSYIFDEYGTLNTFAHVRKDGTLTKNQWLGALYYLGKDGLPVKGAVKLSDGRVYTFDSKTGILVKGAFYKPDSRTYYYVGGEKQRGWQLIDGYWHYFDRMPGMVMATKENSDTIKYDKYKDGMYTISSTDCDLFFTFDSKGRLVRGSWLETENGKVYYWGNNVRLVGWQIIDGVIYYFNSDTYAVTGEQVIDGVTYTFDSEGRIQGKDVNVKVDGKYYYFDVNGKVLESHIADHAYTRVVDKGYAAEHGKAGLTDGEHCGVCGHVTIAQKEIAAMKHNIVITTVPRTCTTDGYTLYSCECGLSYKEDIKKATGHMPEDWVVVTVAKPGVPGLEQRICMLCEEVVETREIIDRSLKGDVNGDGKVNASDARAVLRMAAQLDATPDNALDYLDMNDDKKINAMDARIILRKSAQLE